MQKSAGDKKIPLIVPYAQAVKKNAIKKEPKQCNPPVTPDSVAGFL